MARIDIRGSIVPNDYAEFYRWFGMEATCPADISAVLMTSDPSEPLTVYINSPGGEIASGSEIYTMLKNASAQRDLKMYVTGEACSAASIIAMAGYCEMAPTALMMVHCVSTCAQGNHADLEKTAEVLRTADQALCTAYRIKSGMSEEDALAMMEAETWLRAEEAKAKGLIDAVMFENELGVTDNTGMFNAVGGFTLPTEEQMAAFRKQKAEAMLMDKTEEEEETPEEEENPDEETPEEEEPAEEETPEEEENPDEEEESKKKKCEDTVSAEPIVDAAEEDDHTADLLKAKLRLLRMNAKKESR